MIVKVVSSINATHPAAREFNNDLDLFYARRRVLEERLLAEAKTLYSMLQVNFRFDVKPGPNDTVIVTRTWTNPAQYEKVKNLCGVMHGEKWAPVVSGVYRVRAGKLEQIAGTNVLLYSDITDEEWEAIKAGLVPEKFKAA